MHLYKKIRNISVKRYGWTLNGYTWCMVDLVTNILHMECICGNRSIGLIRWKIENTYLSESVKNSGECWCFVYNSHN